MARMISEPAREIPVLAEADVLVVGGGTAGFPAAVAAARAGADVLLVERYGYVGGASSGGLVITIPEDRQGVYTREVEERLIDCKGGRLMPEHQSFGSVWDPEMLKWLGLTMLEEAGEVDSVPVPGAARRGKRAGGGTVYFDGSPGAGSDAHYSTVHDDRARGG